MDNKAQHQVDYGILAAMPLESQPIEARLQHKQKFTHKGLQYTQGMLADKSIVLANTGIGKVNAALTTTKLIDNFSPQCVLLTGTAGSILPGFNEGDVVVAEKVFDADYGELTATGPWFEYQSLNVNPHNKKDTPLIFHPTPALLVKVKQLAQQSLFEQGIKLATVATSDLIPNPAWQVNLLKQSKAAVIAMEDSAVMQACWLLNVASLCVRGISNVAGEHFTEQTLQVAAHNAAQVLLAIINEHGAL
jgi:adenosylhomocysteine nucleosidase